MNDILWKFSVFFSESERTRTAIVAVEFLNCNTIAVANKCS